PYVTTSTRCCPPSPTSSRLSGSTPWRCRSWRCSTTSGSHQMTAEAENLNRRVLRARDAMDRDYAEPLDVRAAAAVAPHSPAHFSRCFRSIFGETPHRYLQRRRVERSMFLLRETDRTVT